MGKVREGEAMDGISWASAQPSKTTVKLRIVCTLACD